MLSENALLTTLEGEIYPGDSRVCQTVSIYIRSEKVRARETLYMIRCFFPMIQKETCSAENVFNTYTSFATTHFTTKYWTFQKS